LAARTAPRTQPTQLERLQAEFEPGEHRSRTQGGKELTYVDISATLNRLNAVLGVDWGIEHATTRLDPTEDGFFAFTQLHLVAKIDGVEKRAYGVGAMTNRDPDMAAKTALAEAIKKAGHQLGIALYLWDEGARNRVNSAMKLATASDAQLKRKVLTVAKERLGTEKPSQKQIADLFGVNPNELSERDVLIRILSAEE
jgi:hypothetical protein